MPFQITCGMRRKLYAEQDLFPSSHCLLGRGKRCSLCESETCLGLGSGRQRKAILIPESPGFFAVVVGERLIKSTVRVASQEIGTVCVCMYRSERRGV